MLSSRDVHIKMKFQDRLGPFHTLSLADVILVKGVWEGEGRDE